MAYRHHAAGLASARAQYQRDLDRFMRSEARNAPTLSKWAQEAAYFQSLSSYAPSDDDTSSSPADRAIRTVTIPNALHFADWTMRETIVVRLYWLCPVCGQPRGEPYPAHSYDGSTRIKVDAWSNPCKHVDYYRDVRREAQENGLNEA